MITRELAQEVAIPLEQVVKIVDDLEFWQNFDRLKPVKPKAKFQEPRSDQFIALQRRNPLKSL